METRPGKIGFRKPPIVEHRSLSTRQQYREEERRKQEAEEERKRQAQIEAKAEWEARKAAETYQPPPSKPYAYERKTMPPLDFAKAVLAGQLHIHHGYLWLDGQYATPARILVYANAKLRQMGLEPVAMVRRP